MLLFYPVFSPCCVADQIYTRLTSVLTNQTTFLNKNSNTYYFPILSLIIKMVNEDGMVLFTAMFEATFHLPLKSSRTRAQTLDLYQWKLYKC